MKEAVIEREFKKRAEAIGGLVRKVKWIGRRGAPDRVVMLPCYGGVAFFVEFKAPGRPLKPHQAREIKRMRESGGLVVVIDSLEQVESFFAGLDQ